MSDETPWLIVGLGNPGAQYSRTRHNVGHMVIDALAGRCSATLTAHKSGTHMASIRLGIRPGGAPGPQVLVATSDSYMNTSGRSISALARFAHIAPDRILVIHDDLDLPEHDLRLKFDGGESGHNGLKSLSQCLGTRAYHRLRVGIGRPPGRQDPADYVLAQLSARDRTEWDVTVEKAADVIEDVALNGFPEAQQRLHSHSSPQ